MSPLASSVAVAVREIWKSGVSLGTVTVRPSSSSGESCQTPGEVSVPADRSEEHTSELQSLMRISYAVFCLKKKRPTKKHNSHSGKHHTTQATTLKRPSELSQIITLTHTTNT